jgi:hypothetical protein
MRFDLEGKGSSGTLWGDAVAAVASVPSCCELAATVELAERASLCTTGVSVAAGWTGAEGSSVAAGSAVAVSGDASVGAAAVVASAAATDAVVLTSTQATSPDHKPSVPMFKRTLLLVKFLTMARVYHSVRQL